MKKVDDVIRAIALCTSLGSSCLGCPYHSVHDCTTEMELDAMQLLLENRTMIAYKQSKENKQEATA